MRRKRLKFTSVVTELCRDGRISSTLWIRLRRVIPTAWRQQSEKKWRAPSSGLFIYNQWWGTWSHQDSEMSVPWQRWDTPRRAECWLRSSAAPPASPSPWRRCRPRLRTGPARLWAESATARHRALKPFTSWIILWKWHESEFLPVRRWEALRVSRGDLTQKNKS